MKKVKGIVDIIGIVVKYSAIVMAIIKGIEKAYEELKKISFDDNKEVIEE